MCYIETLLLDFMRKSRFTYKICSVDDVFSWRYIFSGRYIHWMTHSVMDMFSARKCTWYARIQSSVRIYDFSSLVEYILGWYLSKIINLTSSELASLSGWFPLFLFTILCRYGGFSSFADEWHLVILHLVNFGTKQPFIMAVMRC